MLKLKNQFKDKKGEKKFKMGTVVSRSPNSVVTEQFRAIRTNIQFSMVDSSIKTLIVTSARAGAGKSTIAANLSLVLASKNKKVLLVDADLRKPTIHSIFGYMNNYGLTTVITENQDSLSDHIRCDHASGLYVLTSGAIPHNPAELLASNRMKNIIEQMKKEFDLVVFDMPPVLPVTDACILSSEVDGVVFVIPHGEVTLEDAAKSKTALEKVNANIIGAVLNRTKANSSDELYYYVE